MPYVRLKGPLSSQHNVNGRYLQGGLEYELSEAEIKAHKDILQQPNPFESPAFESLSSQLPEKEPASEVVQKRIYTEKELFDMNKEEQATLLNSFGVLKIPALERSRVEKILSLQRGEA